MAITTVCPPIMHLTKLPYDQSGRAYLPGVNSKSAYVVEVDGRFYRLVGTSNHLDWQEIKNYTVFGRLEVDKGIRGL